MDVVNWIPDVGYHVARYRRLRHLRRVTTDPLIVFTMGKTGSTAVANALRSALPSRSVLHVHRLTEQGILNAERRFRSQELRSRPGHLWDAAFARDYLREHEQTWEIITLVRDPMAQAVSSFFQTSVAFGQLEDDMEHMGRTFLNAHDWRLPIGWFDREFRPTLGVDIYAHPFDRTSGRQTIATDDARILVLRTEDLSRVGGSALTEFFSLSEPVELVPENVSAEKSYRDQYVRFKAAASAVLPDTVLDELYDSRYARHFYTEAEIRRFRSRWG